MSRTGDEYIGIFDDLNFALESERADARHMYGLLRRWFLCRLADGHLLVDGCRLSDGSRFSFALPVENGEVQITGSLRSAIHEHTLI